MCRRRQSAHCVQGKIALDSSPRFPRFLVPRRKSCSPFRREASFRVVSGMALARGIPLVGCPSDYCDSGLVHWELLRQQIATALEGLQRVDKRRSRRHRRTAALGASRPSPFGQTATT
jgi:hypothetical protein